MDCVDRWRELSFNYICFLFEKSSVLNLELSGALFLSFFSKILVRHMSICGATDTLVLDFRTSCLNLHVSRIGHYRLGTVNSNTVNSKFHLIRFFYDISANSFSIISCLKSTVNSNFHLFRSKTLPRNHFELTVSDLYR